MVTDVNGILIVCGIALLIVSCSLGFMGVPSPASIILAFAGGMVSGSLVVAGITGLKG
jgi:hypothetical protein